MATLGETIVVAVMVLFGVVTAGVLAFALRDMVGELAGDAAGDHVGTALRVALVGPAIYLVGFAAVVVATLSDPGPVAGVSLLDAGIAVIVLAAVPMAVGFYLARQAN